MPLTPTAGHGLHKYDTGDNPGAAGLNFNWDLIDTMLVGIGTSFPAAYPVGGPFIRADQQIMYQNVGTLSTPVWLEIIGGGAGGDPNDNFKFLLNAQG
jgi:hypothetical protein